MSPLLLAWSNLAHKRGRTAIAAGGVAFAVVLIFMELGLLGGGDEEVEVELVEEHGRGPPDAAEQAEFHEDEDDRERDPAGRDRRAAALVREVRPRQEERTHWPGSSVTVTWRPT